MSENLNRPKSVAVAYTITAPTTGWENGSLAYAGTTYIRRCVIDAQSATQDPIIAQMSYAGGDYDAYCQIGVVDTGNEQVTLWARTEPKAICQIRIAEVRNG